MNPKPKPKDLPNGVPDYELLGLEWRKIGLSAPSRRALVDAKLYKVSDLRKISRAELNALHGMGKSALARINVIMEAKKISFRT
jgi:DNA repair protein RadC